MHEYQKCACVDIDAMYVCSHIFMHTSTCKHRRANKLSYVCRQCELYPLPDNLFICVLLYISLAIAVGILDRELARPCCFQRPCFHLKLVRACLRYICFLSVARLSVVSPDLNACGSASLQAISTSLVQTVTLLAYLSW
jgi:hypothetical protein